jgi:hypothetical protein
MPGNRAADPHAFCEHPVSNRAWGFFGCEDDPAQEPDVVFDGTAAEAMESMVRDGRSSDGVRARYLG